MGVKKTATTEKINPALQLQKGGQTKGNSEGEMWNRLRNFIVKVTDFEAIKGRGSRGTKSKETMLFCTEKAHNFFGEVQTS